MIANAMLTRKQKRRIVYCNDSLWEFIEMQARLEGKKVSQIIRKIIEERRTKW